jgi:hypothetical protein
MRAVASFFLVILVVLSIWAVVSVTGLDEVLGIRRLTFIPHTVQERPSLTFGALTICGSLIAWSLYNIYNVSKLDTLSISDLVTDYVAYAMIPFGFAIIAYLAARLGVAAGSSDWSFFLPFLSSGSKLEKLQESNNATAVGLSQITYFLLGARTGFRPIPTVKKLFSPVPSSDSEQNQADQRNRAQQSPPARREGGQGN